MQALPGADIVSDHNILIAKICTTLKKIIKFQNRIPQRHMEKLYTQKKSAEYSRKETRCNWM